MIGETVSPPTSKPSAPAAARTSASARARAASSRTIPPLPTSARPTSNCGLTSAITGAPGLAKCGSAGSTRRSEMNDTSMTTRSTGAGSRSGGAVRMLVRSMICTRGSDATFQSSCPCPTSTQVTCAAPRCSRQSVNPPVDAPTSSAVSPRGSTPKTSSACASLSPPRDTNGIGPDRSRSSASASTRSPAFSTGRSPASTSPARISARAFSREGASPWSTSARSARTRLGRALPAFSPAVEDTAR